MTQNSPKPNTSSNANAVELSNLKAPPTFWAELEAVVPNTSAGEERQKKMLSDLSRIAPLSFDDSSTAEEMSFSEKSARRVARMSAQYVANLASSKDSSPLRASLTDPESRLGTANPHLSLAMWSRRYTYNADGKLGFHLCPARFSMLLAMASMTNSALIPDLAPIAIPMKRDEFLAELIKEINPSLNTGNSNASPAQEELVRRLASLLNLTPKETTEILRNNDADNKTLPLETTPSPSAGPGF